MSNGSNLRKIKITMASWFIEKIKIKLIWKNILKLKGKS
jgi:hypothetical protein